AARGGGRLGLSHSIVRYVNVREDDSGTEVSARRARGDGVADVDHEADGPPGSAAGGSAAGGSVAGDSAAGAASGGRRGADSDRPAGGRRTGFVQALGRGPGGVRRFLSGHPSPTPLGGAPRPRRPRAAGPRVPLALPRR